MGRWLTLNGGTQPRRAHTLDAGLDIAIRGEYTIQPGETRYLPSGVSFDLGSREWVHVLPRSSSVKRGLLVIPSVIDRGYTGEISTIVVNITNEPVTVADGTSLAQIVLSTFDRFDNEFISHLERGTNRFGSTGAQIEECERDG